MIIKLNGEVSMSKLSTVLKEVIGDIQKRTGIEETRFKLKDVQLGVVFNVEGEGQYLTVEHEGVREIFQVNVQLDKNGNIKKAVDNEEESFLDEYTKRIGKGIENIKEEPIESVFKDEDLILVREEDGGDLIGRYYTHRETREHIIRYYRNGVLVGEVGYTNK